MGISQNCISHNNKLSCDGSNRCSVQHFKLLKQSDSNLEICSNSCLKIALCQVYKTIIKGLVGVSISKPARKKKIC